MSSLPESRVFPPPEELSQLRTGLGVAPEAVREVGAQETEKARRRPRLFMLEIPVEGDEKGQRVEGASTVRRSSTIFGAAIWR